MLLGKGDGTFQHYRKTDQQIALAVADLTVMAPRTSSTPTRAWTMSIVQYGGGTPSVNEDPFTGLLAPGAVKLTEPS